MGVRVVSASFFILLAACGPGGAPLELPESLHAEGDLGFGPVVVDGQYELEVPIRNLSGVAGWIQARTDAPFAIVGPARIELPADGTAIVPVMFQPRQPGDASAILVVRRDGEVGRDIELRITGRGVAPILTSDDKVQFLPVPLGAWQFKSIPVYNGSEVTTPVELAFEAGSSPAFSLADRDESTPQFEGQAPLLPGNGSVFRVRFMPDTVEDHEGALLIRTCEICGVKRVALKGSGIYPNVEASEGSLDFGEVLVGETRDLTVDLVEPIWQLPFDLLDWTITGEGAASYELIPPTGRPRHVDPGVTTLAVRFSPHTAGPIPADLQVAVGGEQITIVLAGTGRGASIISEPSELDFGLWPAGQDRTLVLHLMPSDGSGQPLDVSSARIEGDPSFSVSLPAGGFRLSAGGLYVPVTLLGSGSGVVNATLVLDAGAPAGVQLRIPLRASLAPSSFCSLWVQGSLRFGMRPVGTLGQRTIRLHNPNANSCTFGDLEIAGNPAFTLAVPPAEIRTLAPGESAEVVVNYRPRGAAPLPERATLRVRQPNRSAPQLEVPISGQGGGSLSVDPVVFKPVAVGEVGLASATLHNRGTGDLRNISVRLASGDRSSFEILGSAGLGVGLSVGPESGGAIPLAFRPRRVGVVSDELQIFATGNATDEPVIVALTGEGLTGCSTGCDIPVVSCPSSISAPAFDWVRLGTAALDPRGGSVTCSLRVTSSRPPERFVPHGCDADLVLGGAGDYQVELTARDSHGGTQTCRVGIDARSPRDEVVIRSWPEAGSSDVDLRLFPPDGGDVAHAETWDGTRVCSAEHPNQTWGEPSLLDDPIFHNGSGGMPDVIRIPEPGTKKMSIGVTWQGTDSTSLSAKTEVYCGSQYMNFSSELAEPRSASYVADLAYASFSRCEITPVGKSLSLK